MTEGQDLYNHYFNIAKCVLEKKYCLKVYYYLVTVANLITLLSSKSTRLKVYL